MSELKDYVTLVIAIAGLLLAIVNFERTSRISNRQFLVQFTQDAHKWAASVLSTFNELIDPVFAHRPITERKNILGSKMALVSSLWDEGRLLFPNEKDTSFGADKLHAFQGVRPPILDVLKEYRSVLHTEFNAKGVPYDDDKNSGMVVLGVRHEHNTDAYVEIKKRFVSEVQKVIGTEIRYNIVSRQVRNATRPR